MRYWIYCEPVGESSEAVWMIYSDDAILSTYWETWKAQGIAYNKAHGLEEHNGISPMRCIDDWITTHWAVPATPEKLFNIISAPKPQ